MHKSENNNGLLSSSSTAGLRQKGLHPQFDDTARMCVFSQFARNMGISGKKKLQKDQLPFIFVHTPPHPGNTFRQRLMSTVIDSWQIFQNG